MPSERIRGYLLLWLSCIAVSLLLWGIRRDLPYTPEVDEPTFVERAVAMVATGNLNPQWFGHPGSPVIYPLAAMYHVQQVVHGNSGWFQAAPAIQGTFATEPGSFYLLGRLLSVTYGAAGLAAVYQLGRRVFDRTTAMLGLWFLAISPLVVAYAQVVRTDSAATFWGIVSLYLCLQLLDRPRFASFVWAGAAMGLAVATRYFMITLLPVLLLAEGYLLWQALRRRKGIAPLLLYALAGLVAAIGAFALTTPYFFLDFQAALASLRFEARSYHPGGDGLTPLGNVAWYATTALPRALSWPIAICAIAGTVFSVRARQIQQCLLISFVIIFLSAISLSPLHWDRWIIPCLPLLALFAAHFVTTSATWIARRGRRLPAIGLLTTAAVMLLSMASLSKVVVMDIKNARPSTRVLARAWIEEHVPAGSRIAQEWYTAPLGGTDFVVLERFTLAVPNALVEYRQGQYRYVVVSSAMYRRFLAAPERYPTEVAFYQSLFTGGREVQHFSPTRFRGGPLIHVFEISEQGAD